MQYQKYYDELDEWNEFSPEDPVYISYPWDVYQRHGCAHTESPLPSMTLHPSASVHMDLTHTQPQMYDAQENTFAQEPSLNWNANNDMYNVHKNAFAEISTQDTYSRINGEKFNVCDICKKSFSKKSHLKIHLRVHTGEKPYECNACGKAFSLKGNMQRHYRIHTGEKRHACSICSKTFTQKITLTHHVRIHTGEKPYVCGICNKAFNQRSNLKSHELIHSEE